MRRSGRDLLFYSVSLGVLILGLSTPVMAEAPAAAEPKQDEIVVTARKRSETLLSVPVAVSVVTQQQLTNNVANNLQNIAELTPGVFTGEVVSGTGAILSIRGVGSSPFDAGIDQSVSVDIDGVQISRGRLITSAYFDIRQVEVLKGPQALFFGKNSPAGVISIKSETPTDHFFMSVKGGYEFEAREKFGEAVVSGPITDTLKFRAAFRGSGMDGWNRNIAPATPQPNIFGFPGFPAAQAITQQLDHRAPASREFAGRFTLQWTPTSDFDAIFRFTADSAHINDGGANVIVYCPKGGGQSNLFGFPDPGNPCRLDSKTRSVAGLPAVFAQNYPYANGGIPFYDSKNYLASLVLNKKFGWGDVTSTTGYVQEIVSDAATDDDSRYALVYDAEHEKYELITQELRASTDLSGPINFTGGFYFEHFKRPHFNAPFLGFEGLDPAAQNYTNNQQQIANSGDSWSVFGQARWSILQNLELAGGARYSHDKKSATFTQISVNPGNILGPLHPVGVPYGTTYRGHNVSPEATLTWHPAPDMTLYAAFKTGYKSGGIANTAVIAAATPADAVRFGAEKSKGEEIGFKGELFDRTLRLSLIAYRYDYRNLQVSIYDPATISYQLRNAASSKIKGVEAEATWRSPIEGLQFQGSFNYNDAHYANFPGAQCYGGQTVAQGCIQDPVTGVFGQNLAGKPLLRAPKYSFNLGADYTVDALVPGWSANFHLDGKYTSSTVISETAEPVQEQKPYWLLNASLKIGPTDGKYDFSIIGRNLTDTSYAIYSTALTFGAPGVYAGFVNRPREVVLQATYHY